MSQLGFYSIKETKGIAAQWCNESGMNQHYYRKLRASIKAVYINTSYNFLCNFLCIPQILGHIGWNKNTSAFVISNKVVCMFCLLSFEGSLLFLRKGKCFSTIYRKTTFSKYSTTLSLLFQWSVVKVKLNLPRNTIPYSLCPFIMEGVTCRTDIGQWDLVKIENQILHIVYSVWCFDLR